MGLSVISLLGLGSLQVVRAESNVNSVKEYTVVNGLDGLDGIGNNGDYNQGVQQNQNPEYGYQDQSNRDSANAVGGLFQNAGVDQNSINSANSFIAPLAKGINIVSAFLLGFTSLGIFLITALDLMYIAFPPVRNMLNPQSSGGGSPYGGGSSSSGTRWISDEAIACVGSSGGGGDTGGMNSMSGYGGGGQSQGAAKSMILSYLKKRTVFLVVFAITTILFTSTVFTDLGIRLGMLVLGWITGVTASVPV